MNKDFEKDFEKDFNAVLAPQINRSIKSFDFATCELTVSEIAEASELEREFLNCFRKYKNNLYAMCATLANIEKLLKKEGTFMSWYSSIGLTKDNVSVLLKRWSLFNEFPDYKEKIFAYSDQAIKLLTSKKLEGDAVLGVLADDIFKAKDIKNILGPVTEKTEREYATPGQKFFNFNKIKKMKKRTKVLSEDDKKVYKTELEKYIKEMTTILEEL